MSRVTTTILIVMILTNGGVTVMEGSGLSDDLGVTLSPGIDKTLEEINQDTEKFRTSEGLGDTLFALFASAGGIGEIVISGAFAAPGMLINLGFPGYIVAPLFAPMYLLGSLELVSIFTGRRMI